MYAAGEEFATRNASQEAIQALAAPVPELFGGSADLSESNLTDVKGDGRLRAPDEPGRNLRFGVREHAMGGIANGIAYHGGFIPYDATFLNFSDYMRGSVRLAALAGLHVIYVWTHDSVGLGEDGPTHQPVEHYAALRAMPNLWFVRPGDANETVGRLGARRRASRRARGARADAPEAADARGHGRARPRGRAARRLRAPEAARRGRGPAPDAASSSATGSELQLAFGAAEALEARRHPTRVVSLPCWEPFDAQDQAYRDVGAAAGRPEARQRRGRRRRSAGSAGSATRARSSASTTSARRPRRGTIFEHFGFTADRVADVARAGAREARSAAASRRSIPATCRRGAGREPGRDCWSADARRLRS